MNADRTYYVGTFKEDIQVDNKALAEYNRMKELEKMPKEEKKKEVDPKNTRSKSRKGSRMGTYKHNNTNTTTISKNPTKDLNSINEESKNAKTDNVDNNENAEEKKR